MLSKSDEGILDDRLRNWGRWAADRRPGGSSVLWRMMKRYGKPDKNDSPPEKEERNTMPVDVIDAIKVNRAWQGLPISPLRYETAKWVLVAHFCYPFMPRRIACRQLKISCADYDQLLKLAKYMIHNRIEHDAVKHLATSET